MKHSYLEVKKGNLYSRTKEIGANKTSKNELWTMSRFWITVTNLSWVVWWQNNCWNLEENGQELIWVRQVNEIGTSYHSPVFIKRKKWMSHHEVRPAQSVSMASVLHCFFYPFAWSWFFKWLLHYYYWFLVSGKNIRSECDFIMTNWIETTHHCPNFIKM